jgi:hypothetical protein
MVELFKALTGNLWRFVYAWLLPTTLAVAAVWVAIVPAISSESVVARLARLGQENAFAGGLATAFIILALAVLLALNANPLSRLLEGHPWPRALYDAGCEQQRRTRDRIRARMGREDNPTRVYQLSTQLALYPENATDLMPTRYGNAIAAGLTYSNKHYKMDYDTFAYEFRTLAADPLRRELEDAEAIINFFLALVYLSAAFAVAAMAVGIAQGKPALSVTGLVAALLSRFFYWRAVNTAFTWVRTMRAMIHLTRTDVARAWGLRLPATLAEERQMWWNLFGFVHLGDNKDQRLDKPSDYFVPGTYGLALERLRRTDDAEADAPATAGADGRVGTEAVSGLAPYVLSEPPVDLRRPPAPWP